MEVIKKIEIDYGHRVPNHKSKCFSPHGHRGVIECCLAGDILAETNNPQEGMILDFSEIKKALKSLEEIWDHAFILYRNDPLIDAFETYEEYNEKKFKFVIIDVIPTAENLAMLAFNYINQYFYARRNIYRLQGYGVRYWLQWVKFFETPNSWAIYHAKSK